MNNYSIWMLEYARAEEQPVSSFFDGKHNQGTMRAPFTFIVIKGASQVSMVDVGNDYVGHSKYLADISGCSKWQPIEKILRKIDVIPEDVKTVFITHAHFDHVGENLTKFKNAHFYIQKQEYEKWLWALNLSDAFSWVKNPVDPRDIQDLGQLILEGKATLVDGAMKNVLPGIDLVPALDTHSFGCQYVIINDEKGIPAYACVGDNIYSYKNIVDETGNIKYTPIGFVMCNKVNTLLSLDMLMKLMGNDVRKLLISHEGETWHLFPSWKGEDDLHVAEINLASGEQSYLPSKKTM